jgi:molybdenum cofactor guanylyltransferase
LVRQKKEGILRIFGVILAGGGGRRMGGTDKAALMLGGETLLARAIARLEPQVERLAISANGDGTRFGNRLPVLADATPLGPLAGILAALNWAAPQGATAVVAVAVDTPFFPGDLVPQLCLAAESSPTGLAIAASAKDHPTCSFWPVTLAPALKTFLASGANPRVLDFAEAQHCARARFANETAFRNINTPADLTAAEALLRGIA